MVAVASGDVMQLKPDALAAVPGQPAVQHLLPQAQPGVTADPLPPTNPRLAVGSVSPGDGGNNTRPIPRPAAARRAEDMTAAAMDESMRQISATLERRHWRLAGRDGR